MGRIAEALKKAETQRRESLRLVRPAVHALDPRAEFASLTTDRHAPSAVREPPPAEDPTTPPVRWSPVPDLVLHHEPASAVAEQYRATRTWLLTNNLTGEHRILAVTSSVPNEGKSVTVANLGLAFAEVRHLSVLIIDADFRRRSLAGLFGLPEEPGLTDVLGGRCPLGRAVRATPAKNVHILPAGSTGDAHPAELLSARAAQRVFDEIRDSYHYALVDTPPVQTAADAAAVGALCSGVLLVVRMHRTSAGAVRQSVRWLQSNHLQIVGCVAVAANARTLRQSYDEGNP